MNTFFFYCIWEWKRPLKFCVSSSLVSKRERMRNEMSQLLLGQKWQCFFDRNGNSQIFDYLYLSRSSIALENPILSLRTQFENSKIQHLPKRFSSEFKFLSLILCPTNRHKVHLKVRCLHQERTFPKRKSGLPRSLLKVIHTIHVHTSKTSLVITHTQTHTQWIYSSLVQCKILSYHQSIVWPHTHTHTQHTKFTHTRSYLENLSRAHDHKHTQTLNTYEHR